MYFFFSSQMVHYLLPASFPFFFPSQKKFDSVLSINLQKKTEIYDRQFWKADVSVLDIFELMSTASDHVTPDDLQV